MGAGNTAGPRLTGAEMNEQQKEALKALNIDQLKHLIVGEMYTSSPNYHDTDDLEWIVEELIEKAVNL